MENSTSPKIMTNENRAECEYYIPIKNGYINVYPATDPDYPGVYIGFCKKPGDSIQDLVLVEDNEEQYPDKIRIHVWENENVDYPTSDITVNRHIEDIE